MIYFILFMLSLIIILKLIQGKVIIRFDTFFRKGFKKIKDKFGCYTWVGKQGDGKSYSVCDFITEIRGNKKVICNIKSYCDNNDFCIYEPDFYKIISKFNSGIYDKNYIIFYDELFTLLEKGKLNKSILTFISQLRKRGIYLLTTVQEWLDINVTFRRYCRYYIDCKMINFLGSSFSINTIHNGYEMKWDNDLNEYSAPIIKTTIKKCSKKIADSYDTFEVIKMV